MTSPDHTPSLVSIASGCLCFGAFHNILHGASQPAQPLSAPVSENFGTVLKGVIEYNVIARNGVWSAFRLVKMNTDETRGWFVCHPDVTPKAEVARILAVSGSPYEDNDMNGSESDGAEVAKQGVLVINRYDWGHWDDRGLHGSGSDDNDQFYNNGIGIVDQDSAQRAVQEWKEQDPAARRTVQGGAWLHLHNDEYVFGRIGFNEECTAAVSFLLFTDQTIFTETTFAGQSDPLRRYESLRDRFHRQLREGFDFEGIETVQKDMKTLSRHPPATSSQSGPFQSALYPLRSEDVSAILDKTGAPEICEQWHDSTIVLLNEMVLSTLEHFIVPSLAKPSLVAAAQCLYPQHDDQATIAFHLYSRMTAGPANSPVQAASPVIQKIRAFLESRGHGHDVARYQDFAAGVFATMEFLLEETFELASKRAGARDRDELVPLDIRSAIIGDEELFDNFKYSRVFFEGPAIASGE